MLLSWSALFVCQFSICQSICPKFLISVYRYCENWAFLWKTIILMIVMFWIPFTLIFGNLGMPSRASWIPIICPDHLVRWFLAGNDIPLANRNILPWCQGQTLRHNHCFDGVRGHHQWQQGLLDASSQYEVHVFRCKDFHYIKVQCLNHLHIYIMGMAKNMRQNLKQPCVAFTGLIRIRAWISNYIHSFLCHVITHLCTKIEVRTWMNINWWKLCPVKRVFSGLLDNMLIKI